MRTYQLYEGVNEGVSEGVNDIVYDGVNEGVNDIVYDGVNKQVYYLSQGNRMPSHHRDKQIQRYKKYMRYKS